MSSKTNIEIAPQVGGLVQEKVGTDNVVTAKGDFIASVPDADWRKALIQAWNEKQRKHAWED